MHYILLYQYTTHWLPFHYGITMLFSYATVDFYLFNDGVADMQIWGLLTKSQCSVSDTQVTVKAVGLLLMKKSQCRMNIYLPVKKIQYFRDICINRIRMSTPLYSSGRFISYMSNKYKQCYN